MTMTDKIEATLHQIEDIIIILRQKNASGQFDVVLAAYLDLHDFLLKMMAAGKNDG